MKKAGTDGMKLRVLVDNNTYIDRYYLGNPRSAIILNVTVSGCCLMPDIPMYS